MIETLLGGLLGGAFRLAPEILKWFDRRGERGHELAMQDKALEFEKIRGAQRMDEIGAGADAAWNVGAIDTLREAVRTQLKPLENQLATIESRVAKLGKEAEAARNALADPGIYDDAQRDRLKQLMAADARLKADLAQAEDDWLHISAKIEALKAEETVS